MAKTAKKSVKTVVKKATVAKKAVVKKVAVKKATAKVLSKAAVKTYVAQSGLKVDVFDAKGKVVSSMTLPKELFDMPINKTLMAQAVRVFLGNQRQGTVSTKTRGEVAGSTRKIYRQKGTGRARHGGIRAPIFVKGGIAHGPKPKDYTFSLPVKMRRKALFSALSAKVKEGGIRVVSGLSKIEPKTKPVAELLNAIAAEKVLLVMPQDMENVYKAARNITGVSVVPATRINTYEVLGHKTVVFMQEAIDAMEKTFVKGAVKEK